MTENLLISTGFMPIAFCFFSRRFFLVFATCYVGPSKGKRLRMAKTTTFWDVTCLAEFSKMNCKMLRVYFTGVAVLDAYACLAGMVGRKGMVCDFFALGF